MVFQCERLLARTLILTLAFLLPKPAMAQGLCSWLLGVKGAWASQQKQTPTAVGEFPKFEFLKDVPVSGASIYFPQMPTHYGVREEDAYQIANYIREAEAKGELEHERTMGKALEDYTGYEPGVHPRVSFSVHTSEQRPLSANRRVQGVTKSKIALLNCESGKCKAVQSIDFAEFGNPNHFYGDFLVLPLSENEFALLISGGGLNVLRLYTWDANKNLYKVREEVRGGVAYGHLQKLLLLTDGSLLLQSNHIDFVYFKSRSGVPSLANPKVLEFYDGIIERNLQRYIPHQEVIAIPLIQGGFAVTHPGAEIAIIQEVASGDFDVVQVLKSQIPVYHSIRVSYLVQMADGNLVSTYNSGLPNFQIWRPVRSSTSEYQLR